jgi:hypothetical protein
MNSDSPRTIDGIEYNLLFAEWDNLLGFKSRFSEVNVRKDYCETLGYYKFCFRGFRYQNLVPYSTEANLTITKLDCIEYEIGNTTTCKKKIGSLCNNNTECTSDLCLHGVCSFKKNICGDGYCDKDEQRCGDCNDEINIITQDPFTFTLLLNKTWQKPPFILYPTKTYTFKVQNAPLVASKKSSYSPCPQYDQNAIVAMICGECYAIDDDIELTPKSNCYIETRNNNPRLFNFNIESVISIIEKKSATTLETTTTIASTSTVLTTTTTISDQVQKTKVEKISQESTKPTTTTLEIENPSKISKIQQKNPMMLVVTIVLVVMTIILVLAKFAMKHHTY